MKKHYIKAITAGFCLALLPIAYGQLDSPDSGSSENETAARSQSIVRIQCEIYSSLEDGDGYAPNFVDFAFISSESLEPNPCGRRGECEAKGMTKGLLECEPFGDCVYYPVLAAQSCPIEGSDLKMKVGLIHGANKMSLSMNSETQRTVRTWVSYSADSQTELLLDYGSENQKPHYVITCKARPYSAFEQMLAEKEDYEQPVMVSYTRDGEVFDVCQPPTPSLKD